MKKRCRKVLIMFVAAVMAFTMISGCADKKSDSFSGKEPGQSDSEYVKSKGTLVVGITDFAPMDYRDREDWMGFDADLAEKFADSIGVSVKFVEIDWNKKTELLEKGNIDCIWNGMTITEELQQTISCSMPYLSNAQVVVLRSRDMKQYSTREECQHLLFAVEAGSTGEALLKEMRYRYKTYSTQHDALQSVKEKKADAAVIDIIMAAYNMGDGQTFDDLGFHITLNDEKICIGFRKDSDLTEQVNDFIHTAYEDGTIQSLAEQYEIEDALLDDVDNQRTR